jgi:hypothetical protein
MCSWYLDVNKDIGITVYNKEFVIIVAQNKAAPFDLRNRKPWYSEIKLKINAHINQTKTGYISFHYPATQNRPTTSHG